MYRKHLWPFPATLKQRYASLGLFSWCAGYCCLFSQFYHHGNCQGQQIGEFYPTKLVIVTSLWCWLIYGGCIDQKTVIWRNKLFVNGIQTNWLLWVDEDKPCAAVQFPRSGPELVSWTKNSLLLRTMREKTWYFSYLTAVHNVPVVK